MATGSPDYSPRIITSGSADEQLHAAVDDSETTATFTQTVLSFLIYNDGPYSVYVSRATGVDTDSFEVPSGAGIAMDIPTDVLYFKCDTDENAVVKIWGIW